MIANPFGWHPWGWCGVCNRRLNHDRDPWWEEIDPDHYAEDGPYQVALAGGLFVNACWTCWMKWPREHVLPPERGTATFEAMREAFARLNIVAGEA